MPSFLSLPPVAQGAIAISAVALAIVRLLTASRPFWASTPAWLQKALPAALMAIAAIPTAIENARSWMDVAVAIVVSAAMYWTASRGDKRPPEDSSGGPRVERTNSDPKLTREELTSPPQAWKFTVISLLMAGCASLPITSKRCDFQNPEYAAHVALCRRDIEAECLLDPDGSPVASCPALQRCEAWRVKECQ
jgi:hypothetical protein